MVCGLAAAALAAPLTAGFGKVLGTSTFPCPCSPSGCAVYVLFLCAVVAVGYGPLPLPRCHVVIIVAHPPSTCVPCIQLVRTTVYIGPNKARRNEISGVYGTRMVGASSC
ncbi:unnamed protein product [Ectocarpus fasciculatus]